MAITLALGCGTDNPDVVPVSGTVTRNGKPVPNVEVYFQPSQGRPSYAVTDAQGKFELGYTREQNGALIGNHTVYITYLSPEGGADAPPPPELREILDKYGTPEKSPLKVEIKGREDNLPIKLD